MKKTLEYSQYSNTISDDNERLLGHHFSEATILEDLPKYIPWTGCAKAIRSYSDNVGPFTLEKTLECLGKEGGLPMGVLKAFGYMHKLSNVRVWFLKFVESADKTSMKTTDMSKNYKKLMPSSKEAIVF